MSNMLDESITTIGSSAASISELSEPSSPEETGNWHRSLQIDMKGLVGDAVGNVRSLVTLLQVSVH
jgi:hypothetical protein